MQNGGEQQTPHRTIMVTAVCPKPMRKRDVWRVDQFHLVKKIGSGYASSVYLGTCHLTGNQVAIKLYHKNKLSELNLFQVGREIRIHGSLDHKNIVQLWAAFEDQFGIYLITEYASKGDVFTEVERRGGQMTEAETVRQVIHPFCSALQYLHSNNIIHRDIKPENLLFTATGVLKVGDFGLSIDINEERPVTRVGTLDYMAPEVVICPDKHRPSDNKEMTHLYYTCLVDSWAVGVLAYELIVGRPPFDKGAKKATIQEILGGEPFLPPWLSEGASHFIRWSLTKSQRDRPGVQQLVEHPWVVGHLKAASLAHLKGVRTVLGRADSFVEPRSMGLLPPDSPVNKQDSALASEARARPSAITAANPSLAAIKASGKPFLQHSSSLNAADTIRFRDLKFDPSPLDPDLGPMPMSAAAVPPQSAIAAVAAAVAAIPPAPTVVAPRPQLMRKSGGACSTPPSLERRISNMLGAAALAAAAAANGSPGSRRQSGVNNVLMESRSRRQSGVGHALPDTVPASPSFSTNSSGVAPHSPQSPFAASLMLLAGTQPTKCNQSNSSSPCWPGASHGCQDSPPQPSSHSSTSSVATHPWPGLDSSSVSSPCRSEDTSHGLRMASSPTVGVARSSLAHGSGGAGRPHSPRQDAASISRLSMGYSSSSGISGSSFQVPYTPEAPCSPLNKSRSFVTADAARQNGLRTVPLRTSQQFGVDQEGGASGGGQRPFAPTSAAVLPPAPLPPPHPNHHRDAASTASDSGVLPEHKARSYRPGDAAPRSPSTSLVPSRLSFAQNSHITSPFRSMDGRDSNTATSASPPEVKHYSNSQPQVYAGSSILTQVVHPQAPPSLRVMPPSPRLAAVAVLPVASPRSAGLEQDDHGLKVQLPPGSPISSGTASDSPTSGGKGGDIEEGLFKKGIFASFKRVFS